MREDSELNFEEVYIETTSHFEQLLEKERQSIIGRMMPPYIHDVNGTIGAIHMLSSYQSAKIEEIKSQMISNSLKKTDLEELLNVLMESTNSVFQSCEHLSHYNESLRATSNRMNKPAIQDFWVGEVIEDFGIAIKPYFKKLEMQLKCTIETTRETVGDPSWLICWISLWIHLVYSIKIEWQLPIESLSLSVVNDGPMKILLKLEWEGDSQFYEKYESVKNLMSSQLEWQLIQYLIQSKDLPYIDRIEQLDDGSFAGILIKED